jgi:threonine dehydrogenase-like Zn-dependent dehydrogenase
MYIDRDGFPQDVQPAEGLPRFVSLPSNHAATDRRRASRRSTQEWYEAGRRKGSDSPLPLPCIISHRLGLGEAPNAYKHFDARDEGWTKVVLKPLT